MTELEKAARMALERLKIHRGSAYCNACEAEDEDAIVALTQALATTERRSVKIRLKECPATGEVLLATPEPVPASQTERESFETWARSHGYDLRRNDVLGHYSSIDTSRAWSGFRAGRASLPATTERKLAATPDHNGAPVPASPADMQVYNKIAAGYWTERKGPLSKDQIREVFLAHGFTVKEGQTDLKPYVYDAAYALIALMQPATERKGEPVATVRTIRGVTIGYLETRLPDGTSLYTSPQVPEDVIAILDECRTALMECDRDCDYELIDRAYAAIDAARKEPRR